CRRDRVPEEGDEVVRGGTAILGDGRPHRELSDRGVPGLRERQGACLDRSSVVLTRGMDQGSGPLRGGRNSERGRLRYRAPIGRTDVGAGMAGRSGGGVGDGRYRLRPRREIPPLLGGQRATLCAGDPGEPTPLRWSIPIDREGDRRRASFGRVAPGERGGRG